MWAGVWFLLVYALGCLCMGCVGVSGCLGGRVGVCECVYMSACGCRNDPMFMFALSILCACTGVCECVYMSGCGCRNDPMFMLVLSILSACTGWSRL